MSDTRDPATDQQLPLVNAAPFVQDEVIADIEERKQHGIRKYGTALQGGNGRDMLLDAYEEALDLTIYLRGALDEQAALRAAGGQGHEDWCRYHDADGCASQPRRPAPVGGQAEREEIHARTAAMVDLAATAAAAGTMPQRISVGGQAEPSGAQRAEAFVQRYYANVPDDLRPHLRLDWVEEALRAAAAVSGEQATPPSEMVGTSTPNLPGVKR